MERRDNNKVAKVWSQIYNQLQEWEAGSSSSLYGEDTPSMEIGNLQKRFAKVYVYFMCPEKDEGNHDVLRRMRATTMLSTCGC